MFFINNFTYASLNTNTNNPYKQELLTIKNGYKYQKQIEKFVNKLDNNKAKKVIERIEKINKKLEAKSDSKSKKIKIILNYLKFKLENKLNSNLDSTLETKKIKNNISQKDKEYIENEIIKVQLNLLNSSESLIKKLSSDFNKYSQYEEKWNLKVSFNLDYDEIWKINSQAEFKNYIVKNKLLDNSFNTEVNVSINTQLKNDLEKKLKIDSKIDYIQNDWLEYFLVEKFKVIDNKWFEDFKEYLDTFAKLAKENKYIEMDNNEVNTDIIKNIKKINPQNILADSKNILSKPFLEAYNKTWNKYYLKPTKYACDKIKEISNKFDPVYWKTCSESQYNDLLKEINTYWNLYLTVNNQEKELVYEYKKTTKLDSWIISIKFDDKKINSIYVNIVPNQNKYKNEWLTIDYKNAVQLKINNKWYRDEFRLGFILDWYKINWNIDYITSRYDWNSDKYVQDNVFNANLSWQKNNWKLIIKDKDLKDNTEILNSDIKYNNWVINWETQIKNKDSNILKIDHNWKVNINSFELNNKIIFDKNYTKTLLNQSEKSRDTLRIMDLKMLQSALEQYYADNSEYPETIKDNKELADYLWKLPKDPLGAVEIDWCKFGYYYEVWEDKTGVKNQVYKLSTCLENSSRATSWNKFELSSWKISKTNKAFYINWFTSWKKITPKNNEYNLEENINIKISTNNNKNNFYLLINALLNSKEIFNFQITNQSKRTYKEVKINKLSNTIKLKDALK